MKNLITRFFLISVVIGAGCSPTEHADPLVASLDSIMTAVADTARFNGNVLFARNGKVIYKKSFGWANFETKEPLNDSSLFELGSVSKQFTAMGIMILKERGKLNYDDDLRKFLPELPYEGLTIRHLLHHTAGSPALFDINEPPLWDRTKINFNDDIIAMMALKKPPVFFKPGEQWQYSNTGYLFLASVIERVSGQSLDAFLRHNIFEPLGMPRSRVYNTRRMGETISNCPYGYVYVDSLDSFMLPDSLDFFWFLRPMDGLLGAGNINSTTEELFKWNEALYTDKLVKSSTLAEAFEPASLNDGNTYPYGFGWRVENDSLLGRITRHSGGWPGYYSQIRRYLDSKDCLVFLSNNDGYGRGAIVPEIEKRLRRDALKSKSTVK